ncbi:uncharacterized protein EI90DRAFT_3052146 [Cantharellus anzutake]|uniref:uncharacterized protein n=1 Tax=Cantharellus anzutake TaxID=1750568 RepID=UPI001904C84B|nr:uncharacterized protein EI90DRAFT_3052146 [Cantharellus anzutake]KAF8333477.1 hypothetical protein EI90DRAFT_3052146 [Cantharellus anzutake]
MVAYLFHVSCISLSGGTIAVMGVGAVLSWNFNSRFATRLTRQPSDRYLHIIHPHHIQGVSTLLCVSAVPVITCASQ